jgi:hypothetical protein
MLVQCLFLALLGVSPVSAAVAPPPIADFVGARAFLTQRGFAYIDTLAKAEIIAGLKDVKIPSVAIKKDGFNINLDNLECKNVQVSTLDISATSGSLGLQIDGVAVTCTGDWKYKLHSWPHIPKGHGSVDISVGGSSSIVASITISNNDENNTNIGVGACATKVDITNLHFHGGLSGDILNLLKHVIESAIERSLKSKLCDVVKTEVKTKVQPEFQKVPLSYLACGSMENALFCDFHLPLPAMAAPPFPVPPLPVLNNDVLAAKELALALGSFPLNDIFYNLYNSGVLDITITPNMVPPSSPIQLNTSAFKDIAPGMFKKWPNQPMQLEVNVSKRPILAYGDDAATLTVPLDMTFSVIGPKSGVHVAFVETCPFTLATAVSIDSDESTGNSTLKAMIKALTCFLELKETTVGNVSSVSLNQIVAVALLLGEQAINKKLKHGIVLPTHFHSVELQNSSIFYFNGTATNFVAFGANLVYKPHGFVSGVQSIMGGLMRMRAQAKKSIFSAFSEFKAGLSL